MRSASGLATAAVYSAVASTMAFSDVDHRFTGDAWCIVVASIIVRLRNVRRTHSMPLVARGWGAFFATLTWIADATIPREQRNVGWSASKSPTGHQRSCRRKGSVRSSMLRGYPRQPCVPRTTCVTKSNWTTSRWYINVAVRVAHHQVVYLLFESNAHFVIRSIPHL